MKQQYQWLSRVAYMGLLVFVLSGVFYGQTAQATTGPTVTLYKDDKQIMITDATNEFIQFDPDTRDIQALRLPQGGDYYVAVLLWEDQTLKLQLYTTVGELLDQITVLTLSNDKTFSVVKLAYDNELDAMRVQANLRNSKNRPAQLVTKWYTLNGTPALAQIDTERKKIKYPKKKLQDDNDAAGLAFFNWERAAGGLLPVARLNVLDDKCALHAEYMRLNDEITHTEETANPGYTTDGYAAGTESNLTGQYNTSLYNGVDILTTAIYHRLPMLRNNLHHIGWAVSEVSDQGSRYGCLNVYAAQAWDVTYSNLQLADDYVTVYDPDNHEPLPYPGVRQNHVPIDFITGEHPDPLEDFGGTYPSGYPVSLIFPYEDVVTDMSVKLTAPNGNVLDGYFRGPNDSSDPNAVYQGNTITFIPTKPLHYDKTYQVKVEGSRNGENYSKQWQFTTEKFDENYPWDTN